MKHLTALALVACFLVGCGAPVEPTVDLAALREQIKQDVLAELTASAPTATETQVPTQVPTDTPEPTATITPTETATATATTTPTFTEEPPTATATETPPPTQTPSVTATLTRRATSSPAPAGATRSPTPPPAPLLSGRIAFAAYEPAVSGYSLFTLTSDGTLQVLAHHVHQPDISPDGKLIAVDCAGAGKEDLWALVIADGTWRQLTDHPDDHYPTWSATGLEVGFSSARQGDGVYRLYVGEEQMSTSTTAYVIGDYAILLLTGDMVYSGCDYGWGTGIRCGLWLASRGRVPSRLTDNPFDVPTDANASDVLFLREAGGDWDIYRVGYGGAAPVPVAPSPGRDGPAAFSPDGKSVAFLSERSGSWALYTTSLEGGQVRKLLDLPAGLDFDHAPYPWWSERISWGGGPISPTPTPTPVGGPLLPAPQISLPIWDDTVSSTQASDVRWSWSQALGPNQGFEVRFWHTSQTNPAGVAAPTSETELQVFFGLTDAYRWYGEGFYYLDVVVVQIVPYRVLSESSPVRVKTDPNK